jgi:large subunit ribosomal protein L35
MPKMKTHKGLKKRVRVTANRKVKHRRAFTGHLMSGKPGSRRQRLRRPGFLHGPDVKKALRALQAG